MALHNAYVELTAFWRSWFTSALQILRLAARNLPQDSGVYRPRHASASRQVLPGKAGCDPCGAQVRCRYAFIHDHRENTTIHLAATHFHVSREPFTIGFGLGCLPFTKSLRDVRVYQS